MGSSILEPSPVILLKPCRSHSLPDHRTVSITTAHPWFSWNLHIHLELATLTLPFEMLANHMFFVSKGLATHGDAVDFEAMWAELSASLREIHTKNASKLSFEELYRNAYKLVLKKKGETLYERVKLFEQEWLGHEVRARINGVLSSTLLVGAGGATGNTTVNEKRVAGERFMKGLKQAWEDHNLCVNMTTDVLMYMVSLEASLPPRQAARISDEILSDSCDTSTT